MLRVSEVLERPIFGGSRVVAGHSGLAQPVSWVHIGEIPDLADFLKGGEMILSTGVGLGDADLRRQFMTGLKARHTSALVLELGRYFPEPPDDLVTLASRQGLPLIAFDQPVRFLDVSYDINSLIVSEHHRLLDDLEALSLKLRQSLLNTDGPDALVAALHEATGLPIVYRRRDALDEGDAIISGWHERLPSSHDVALHPLLNPGPPPTLQQTIMVFNQPVADLWLQLPEPRLQERWYLACDRTAAALAQDFLRQGAIEHKRQDEERRWLDALVEHEPVSPALARRFNSRFQLDAHRGFRIVLIDAPRPLAAHKLSRALSGQAQCLVREEDGSTMLVVIGRQPMHTTLPNLPVVAELGTVGISRPKYDAAMLWSAYHEAADAALIARVTKVNALSYQSLGLYRWILSTPPAELWSLLVEPELGPLLDPPIPILWETLVALVQHPDSKARAADALGIQRQSLYPRIARLKDVLGPDFLGAGRRSSIEVAVLAWRFLEATKTDLVPHLLGRYTRPGSVM